MAMYGAGQQYRDPLGVHFRRDVLLLE